MQYTLFGKYLRKIAAENKLTLNDIAFTLKVDPADQYSFYTGCISEELLSKLCTYFDTRVGDNKLGDSLRSKWVDTNCGRIVELIKKGYSVGKVDIDNTVYPCCYKFCSTDTIDIYTERDGYVGAYFTHYKSLVI